MLELARESRCSVATLTLMRAPVRPHNRRGAPIAATVLVLTAALYGCTGQGSARGQDEPTPHSSTTPSTARSNHVPATAPWQRPASGPGHLRRGSNPGALPTDVLIADKNNNRLVVVDPQGRIRWMFPRPGDLAAGQAFRIPDDAFFTPDGRYIIATEEDYQVISVISVATRRIVYRYGVPRHPGSGPNHVDNPDDALMLPDGYILTADIKNCRLLLIAPHTHSPARILGKAGRPCYHATPTRYGSPNGAFPMTNGRYLVTEINGDWVDAVDLHGHVYWSANPPNVAYPSDSNQIGPNRYLTVDYSGLGQIVIFNRAGHTLWRYRPTGRDALDHPSLALPLPNGDILLNDDYNDRVLVVDPHTDRVVWQYGHTGAAGVRPGYLDNPDGVDLVPPHSLLVAHATTMGRP